MAKKLSEISWQVDEPTYREDAALSYSMLATYEREGFEKLATLRDKKESTALTFGSAVDAIITGGDEEFNSRFLVADYELQPAMIPIVKELFNIYGTTYNIIESIPDKAVFNSIDKNGFQPNWRPETRVKALKEKASDYYKLLFLAGNKTILNSETKLKVDSCVRALRESTATRDYFSPNDPFDHSIEKFYQLKFLATFNGVNYRCMSDLLIVDHKRKLVIPCDLKTSGHPEYKFYDSFVYWMYQIQARLYWRIIRSNMDADEYYREFKLADYRFIVVHSETVNPLVWRFDGTGLYGTLVYGKQKQILMRDPFEIGEELNIYLYREPDRRVPLGISEEESNTLDNYLQTL